MLHVIDRADAADLIELRQKLEEIVRRPVRFQERCAAIVAQLRPFAPGATVH